MQKESIAKIKNDINGENKVRQDEFDKKYDSATGRVSYDSKIHDHFFEELQFIAGILDMLVVISGNNHLNELHEANQFVLMDARERALALQTLL